MNVELEENPFNAGPGLSPPYLAGRLQETEDFETTIGFIKDKAGVMDRSPFAPIVLDGPRGVGKTALLSRAIGLARSHNTHVSELSRDLLSGPVSELVAHIFQSESLEGEPSRADPTGAAFDGTSENARLKDQQSSIRLAVPAFLSKSPLLMVLDDAHLCEPESLGLLFGVTQNCMSERLPLALIIAGTPDLEPLMRKSKAGYMDKANYHSISALSQEEAKKALEVPARENGRTFDQDALELLLEWSGCHPYFIQMSGGDAWDVSTKRGGETISIEDAKAGLELSNEVRDEFYAKTRMELVKRNMVGYAQQSARIIQEAKGGPIDIVVFLNRLTKLNDGMDRKTAVNILDNLLVDGYIRFNLCDVESGIPSMFDFMLRDQSTP